MINPNDYPISIAGVAWRDLEKGETIPSNKVQEMFDIIHNKSDVMSPTTGFDGLVKQPNQAINYRQVQVKCWLEEARALINKPIVIRQVKGNLYVLTDDEAVDYLNKRAFAGLNQHRTNTKRMFTRINTDNLSNYQKTQLETNQARHAFISSASDGARKQSLKLLKDGGKLPRINPPDM